MTPYRVEMLQNGILSGKPDILKWGDKITVILEGVKIKVECTKNESSKGHGVDQGKITFPVKKVDVCEQIYGESYTQPYNSSPVTMKGGELIITRKKKGTQTLRIIYERG